MVLSLSAGAMESELVHIHVGPCGPSLGAVTKGLTSIAGGASATLVDATLASLRTGGFAVNAHQKGNPATYTACGSIPAAPQTSELPSPASQGQTAGKEPSVGGTDGAYGY